MRLRSVVVALVLPLVLSACLMSALQVETPTTTLTPNPSTTLTPTLGSVVTVTGNVWIRDASDNTHGYLAMGSVVEATCSGEWCYLADNSGYRFWRGCAGDNPAGLACRTR